MDLDDAIANRRGVADALNVESVGALAAWESTRITRAAIQTRNMRVRSALRQDRVHWLDPERTRFDYLGFVYRVMGRDDRGDILRVARVGKMELADDEGEQMMFVPEPGTEDLFPENWGTW